MVKMSEKLAKKLVLLTLFAVPLLISPSTRYLYSPKFPALQVLGFAVLTAWALSFSGKKTALNIFSPDIPVLLFLAWTGLSVFWAYNKYLAVEWLVALTALISVYFVVSRIKLPVYAIALTLSITAGLVSIYGIIQALGYDFLTEPHPRPVSFIGNTNFAGEFIAPVIILTLALFLKSGAGKMKLLSGASVLLQVIYLSITIARGAWLGLAAGAVMFLILFSGKNARLAGAGLYLAMAVVLSLLLITLVQGSALMDRLAGASYRFASLEHASIVSRLDIWTVSLRMIRDNPVLGSGAGNFHIAFPPYSTLSEFRVIGEHALVNFAHNDFIQVASDLGLVGFAIFTWLIVAAAKIVKKEKDRLNTLEAGVASAILCILVISLFGFPLETPSTAMLFWVLLGVIAGKSEARGRTVQLHGNPLLIKSISCVALAFVTIYSAAVLLSDYHFTRGRNYVRNNEWLSAGKEAAKAVNYYFPSVDAHAILADAYLRETNFEQGYYHLQRTLELNPNHRWANGAIGQIYLNSGNYDKAVEHIKNSVRLRPSLFLHLAEAYYLASDGEKALEWIRKQIKLGAANEYSYFYLGVLSEEKGESEIAARAYRQALRINPRFESAYGKLKELEEGL